MRAISFLNYEQYVDEAAYWKHREMAHFLEHGAGGLIKIAESRTPVFCIPID